MLPFAASENEVRSGAAIVRLFRARCNLLFWALSSAVQVTIGLLCIRLGFHLLGVIVLASLTAPWVYGALMYLIEGKLMWGILTGMGLQPLLQLAFVNREEPLLRSRNVSHISVFTSWSVLASLYLGILVFGEFSSFLSDLRTIPSGLFQERVEQAVRLAAFGFVCCGLQVGWIMTDTHMSLVLRELPPSPRNAGERGCSFGAWAWRHRRETVRFFLGFLAQTIDFSIRIGSLASSVADVPWLILISFVINLLVLMIVTIVFENHFISNFYMGLGIILVGPFILILAGEATVISSLYSARNLLVVRLCEFFVYGCAHTLVGTFSWNPWVHRLYLLGLCELFGLLLMMLLMMLASRMTERPSTGSNLRSPLLGAAAPQGVQLVPQQQQQQQQPPPPPRVNTHIQGRDGESGQARTEEQAEGDREGPRHPPSSSSISMALPSAPPPGPRIPHPPNTGGAVSATMGDSGGKEKDEDDDKPPPCSQSSHRFLLPLRFPFRVIHNNNNNTRRGTASETACDLRKEE
uniref:Uncharacterized protein n=1 Tax=Chromera velia CCMP2878 TaxID=1169474 RepID=A0A0G4HVA6_9ALVE